MTVPDSIMYATIRRQPSDLRRLLSDGWDPAREAANRLAQSDRIFVVGVGTSEHAAQVGEHLLRSVGVDAFAVNSFDFANYPRPLRPSDSVIVMSHRGTKRYSARSMQHARAQGVFCLGVSGLESGIEGVDMVLRTVEQERSPAFTASHLAAMVVLAQIAFALGDRQSASLDALTSLPEHIESILERESEIRTVAEAHAQQRIYILGSGPNVATAREAALKIREASFAAADAMALEQFLHGPRVAVNPGDLLVLVCVDGPAQDRAAQAIRAFGLLGPNLWVVGQLPGEVDEVPFFSLPPLPEVLSPLLAVVPMQLLACFLAAARGVNPDSFRRDDPRYEAAFRDLVL